MAYVHAEHADEAARLLEELKREARPQEVDQVQSVSALGDAAFRHMSIEKATGVHVYRGEMGGWFADITFRDMPAGVPACIGTPVHEPLRTRAEAMHAALGLVEFATTVGRSKVAAETDLPDDMAAFLFHGVTVPLPIEMLDVLRARMPEPDEDYVLRRLDELTRMLGDPDEMDADAVVAAPPEFRQALFPVAAMALLAGVLRFPQFEEASPSPMN